MTITAKFAGHCKRCGGPIAVGAQIEWSREHGARHATPAECVPASAEPKVTKDAPAIAAFLAAARDRGLKYPKVRFLAPGGGELRLSVAGERSRHPGSIQVVVRDEWIGRIQPDGTVSGKLAQDADVLAALDVIAADPAKAAREYGSLMGRCSFCDKSIVEEGSVDVGYGPICAQRYGLPHTRKGTRALKPIEPQTAVVHGGFGSFGE